MTHTDHAVMTTRASHKNTRSPLKMGAKQLLPNLRCKSGLFLILFAIIALGIYLDSNKLGANFDNVWLASFHNRNMQKANYQVQQMQICNLDFLQRYLIKNKRFLGYGKWVNRKWLPKECIVPELQSPAQLVSCLKRKKIRKIGQTGDSQSMKYMAAMKRGEGIFKCKELKRETRSIRTPSPSYFSPPLDKKYLTVANRDCNGCAGELVQCTAPNGIVTSDIEVLITEFIKDHEITTKRNFWKGDCDIRLKQINQIHCQDSVTTQEVYFREYWPLSGYPDVINIYAVHVHEAQKRTPRDFARDFTWFIDLIVSVIPKTTKILYWNSPHVDPSKQPVKWRDVTGNEFIKQLNAISASVIRKYIIEKNATNLYPMFDLYEISKDVLHWNTDGVHFEPIWYKTVISLFWATLCQS
ncbi:uncharacterized protein LOC106172651 [Lingula anatina]|uniref:Uncharacterized protein LOC106172651 n=1 Tax=Lingula anatina TaxID=7574 RepID=A0A1S3JEY3_LINAN|nr:uncharacterized protein LOC106172651 [Lingula anatina]|eukprot:XP_013408898.1 uncharacterized protein LOC106172651 [Lingula anatina]